MALSGSLTTDPYKEENGDENRYYKLTWKATQSTAENKSTISWTLEACNAENNNEWFAERTLKVTIDGSTVYSKTDRVVRYAGEITSGKVTLSHSATGSKSFKVSIEAAVYGSSVNVTGSKSFTLDTIPRYPTVSHSLNARTETTIKMNWSSDSTIDKLWYSTDGGDTWSGEINVADGKSGTYTISNLTPNTPYKVVTCLNRKDSQLYKNSTALSVTTYDYPYCTSAPNFTIDQELTLTFYNPLNRTFDFTIIGNGEQIYTWTGRKGTTYSGVDGEPAVTNLYNSIPDKPSATYEVIVTYGSSNIRTQGGTYSINEDICKPTFTTFSYKDINATVLRVTENNQALVKGLSQIRVDIPSDNKMVAKNGATPKKYTVIIDSVGTDISYVDGAVAYDVSSFTSAGKKRIVVRAIDSRGLYTDAYQDVEVYDYDNPIVNATVKRLNDFEAKTTISVSGNYSLLTIGGANKNQLESVSYRYREKGASGWINSGQLTTTLSNGNFTCNDLVRELDNTKSFEVEITATDKLGNTVVSKIVDVGQATFFMCTNKKTFYIADKPALVCTNETNYAPVDDYVVERGAEKSFVWKKFKSGDFEMRGLVTATDYKSAYVLECGFGFPFDLLDDAIGIATLNEYSTNINDLQRNAKISCKHNSATVTVHNASGAFIDGSTANVMVYIWGRWK